MDNQKYPVKLDAAMTVMGAYGLVKRLAIFDRIFPSVTSPTGVPNNQNLTSSNINNPNAPTVILVQYGKRGKERRGFENLALKTTFCFLKTNNKRYFLTGDSKSAATARQCLAGYSMYPGDVNVLRPFFSFNDEMCPVS